MIEIQYVIDYFKELPTLVKGVWALTGFLFLCIIALIVYLKYLRGYLRKKEQLFEIYESEYEANLINYLYAGEEENVLSNSQLEINDLMKICVENKFKRKIFIKVLSKLKNEISGELADSIQNLYINTGLINYSLTKLKSRKWDIIASGIKELTQFEITNVYEEIIKHENHPKQEVRNEVQLYLVNLFQFKGLDFLNNLKTSISEWNQIQLLEILQKFDDQQITDISPWLKSENDSVVIFALKLAKIYNQFQVIDILLDLLSHKTKEIRVNVIKVLGYFQVSDAKPILKTNFENRSEDEQIAFFELLKDTVDKNDEDFILENIFHNNFEIKVTALKLLKSIHSEKLDELQNSLIDEESTRIFNYLKNN